MPAEQGTSGTNPGQGGGRMAQNKHRRARNGAEAHGSKSPGVATTIATRPAAPIMGIVGEEDVIAEIQAAADYIRKSQAESTERAYGSDWRIFTRWCLDHGIDPLPAPPDAVAVFLAREAKRRSPRPRAAGDTMSVSTIERRYAAIRHFHRQAGHSPPDNVWVRRVLQGIVREKGRRPTPKAPLLGELVARVVAAIPLEARRATAAELDCAWKEALAASAFAPSGASAEKPRRAPQTLTNLRDRALILVGFAGAMRRSEITTMNVEDLAFGEAEVPRLTEVDGRRVEIRERRRVVRIALARSKGNQEGREESIAIVGAPAADGGGTYCPVLALRTWLERAGIKAGPVFREIDRWGNLGVRTLAVDTVTRIVKARAQAAGIDAAAIAAHSLRSGMLTTASDKGADLVRLALHARHKDPRTTFRYIRHRDALKDHPGVELFE